MNSYGISDSSVWYISTYFIERMLICQYDMRVYMGQLKRQRSHNIAEEHVVLCDKLISLLVLFTSIVY